MTPKKQRFIEEYVIDFNGTRAAERAGYSPKTAYQISAELLRQPLVQRAVQAKVQALTAQAGLTAERVLEELALVAFTDMTMFVTWDAAGMVVKPSRDLPVGYGRCVQSVSEMRHKDGATTRLKLYDKLVALEKLARYFHLFAEEILLPGVERTLEGLLETLQQCNDLELRNLQRALHTNGILHDTD